MSDTDLRLTKVLVAQFLQKHGYTKTLATFLKDSGVSMSSVNEKEFEELESIISDRIGFNHEAISEKLKSISLNGELDSENVARFKIPCWNHQLAWTPVESSSDLDTLVIKTRFLGHGLLASATVDKKLIVSDFDHDNVTSDLVKQPGIIKYFGPISKEMFYTCTIDGKVHIRSQVNSASNRSWSFNLPVRAVMAMEMVLLDNKKILLFYCSLNNAINAYIYDMELEKLTMLSEYKLLSVCTALQLAFSEDGCPVLFLSRQDFTQIMMFRFEDSTITHIANIALNTAQFSTHSFNIADMLIVSFDPTWHPMNPHILQMNSTTVLAVATTHTPYMRLITTKIPDLDKSSAVGALHYESANSSQPNILDNYAKGNASKPVSVSNATKTYYDTILQNIATVVPQDSYSRPILKVSYLLGGLIIGADDGLYAVDLQKSDTWRLDFGHEDRIKSMDFYKDDVSVSYASTKLRLWKLEQ
ncbi:unnamed protein product [Kluyveromyces dobzhanskii CBS 2104]|uniref:WGS project CCBQ000000000 data, contig 00012 n=1 Tax=Kluyveromyces dobzhanskii CBS 2104 TaxID=1427455 RepID=A0A0A8L0V7_9SACH|nr:unnamed protein product [Kluyveromyces dobzhanskii CBS 2104]